MGAFTHLVFPACGGSLSGELCVNIRRMKGSSSKNSWRTLHYQPSGIHRECKMHPGGGDCCSRGESRISVFIFFNDLVHQMNINYSLCDVLHHQEAVMHWLNWGTRVEGERERESLWQKLQVPTTRYGFCRTPQRQKLEGKNCSCERGLRVQYRTVFHNIFWLWP